MTPRYVQVWKFCELTGYTEESVRGKIKRHQWPKDRVWVKAPDGHVLMNMPGYHAWVEGNSVLTPDQIIEGLESTAHFGERISDLPYTEEEYTKFLDQTMNELVRTTRKRAEVKGWEMSIDKHFVKRMLHEQGYRCALTGLPFTGETYPNAYKRPWIPSIDRIDGSLGYTPDNVRIVCSAVNVAMNCWDEAVLSRISHAYLARNMA